MKKKLFICLVLLAVAAIVVTCKDSEKGAKLGSSRALQPYQAMDFSHLLGMEGFSEALLNTHFALYKGYVANTNELLEKIRSYTKSGRTDTPEYAELKRRLGFEFNGMKLHELYFGNLGGAGVLPEDNALYDAIEENFGSFENWKKDFTATGKMRGNRLGGSLPGSRHREAGQYVDQRTRNGASHRMRSPGGPGRV